MPNNQAEIKKLKPIHLWAYGMGTALGWGSLVVTCGSYLMKAGPAGSAIGLIIGALVMVIIARNYALMMRNYPDVGGTYTFIKETFGFDFGFLTFWFTALTYLSMLWANATSLCLFARYFIGDIFQFGYLYTLFGYDVYLGEALLSIAGVLIFGLIAARRKDVISAIMVGLVVIFSLGITICFIAAVFNIKTPVTPFFVDNGSYLNQIVHIATISPWAFIGFENISHKTFETDFKNSSIFKLFLKIIVVCTLTYIFVTLLSVTAYPPEYSNWYEYIANRGNLTGIEALPAFYAAHYYLGDAGTYIMMASLLALVITSLIGNTSAISRLFAAAAKDGILPAKLAYINDRGIPVNGIYLTLAISSLVPFIGRVAIGWIVDVTTIGAVIIYGLVSAATIRLAKEEKLKVERFTGRAGLIIMIAYLAYILLSNLFGTGDLEKETYFLFIAFSFVGFIYFRVVLTKDKDKKFGRSVIVWFSLILLMLLISSMWLISESDDILARSEITLSQLVETHQNDEALLEGLRNNVQIILNTNTNNLMIVTIVLGVSIMLLLSNFTLMTKRIKQSEFELGNAMDLSRVDAMTGVKSKFAYQEKEKEINDMIIDKFEPEIAIVVCDVNGLKYINDTFGHKKGDEYICSASNLICDIFKKSPVYRIGGDEFVVVCEKDDYENIDNLLDKFNKTIMENLKNGGVVISAGMSKYIFDSHESFHEIFERADKLMYERKMELKGLGAKVREG